MSTSLMWLSYRLRRVATYCLYLTLWNSWAIAAPQGVSSAPVGDKQLEALPSPPAISSISVPAASAIESPLLLETFKSPSCFCCDKWIAHLQSQGFQIRAQHPEDLGQEKMSRGIAPQYHSCHTAVSAEGYVFEGHIPGQLIRRFLAEKPKNAIGLAVPGMPTGSPGMERGKHITPYDVLLLRKDGSHSIYATITSLDGQP